MCGIAGIYIKTPNHPAIPSKGDLEAFVDLLLLGIEHRGKDATGVFSVTAGARNGKLEKADTQASTFIHYRKALQKNPRLALLHTRLATQGEPHKLENNHPVSYESVVATHNGHIRNDGELFRKYELKRYAEVDSEIISALFYKHGIEKAHLALQELDGGFAVAVADPARYPDRLLLAKGPSSPLHYVETSFAVVWASERTVIEQAWRDVIGKGLPREKFWHELKYGTMHLVTPEESEDFKFEVYHRPYQYGYTSQHSQSGWDNDGWADRSRRAHNEMCSCGHVQWWHRGTQYDEECLTKDCACVKFTKRLALAQSTSSANTATSSEEDREWDDKKYKLILRVTDKGREFVKCYCVQCDRLVVMSNTEDFAGYRICNACLEEEKRTVPSALPSTSDDADPNTWEESYDRDPVLMLVAQEVALSTSFCGWLLWDADDADFEKEPWLVNTYCVVENLYQEYDRRLAEIDCGVIAFESDDEEEATR